MIGRPPTADEAWLSEPEESRGPSVNVNAGLGSIRKDGLASGSLNAAV